MKARVPRSRVTHDRWLVSYADFITLLFGFFVVLYAFAKADQKKQAQVSQAIDSAFRSLGIFSRRRKPPGQHGRRGRSSGCANTVMGEDVVSPAQVKDDLERIRRDLTATLSNQVAAHTISLEMGRDGLVISLREAGFFDSGSAVPKPETLPTLRQIAATLGSHALRSAHRGPHRQCAHPQRAIRFELGALYGARHAHRPALSRNEGHSAGPTFGRRLRGVPSRGQQRRPPKAAPKIAAWTWS